MSNNKSKVMGRICLFTIFKGHLHSPCESIGLVQVEGYIASKNRTRDTQPVIAKACYLLKSSNGIEVAKQSAL